MNTVFKAILGMDLRNASRKGNPLAMWKFECPARIAQRKHDQN